MTMNGFAERVLHVMIPINQHFLITLYTIFEDHYEPLKVSLFQILNDLCKGELPNSGSKQPEEKKVTIGKTLPTYSMKTHRLSRVDPLMETSPGDNRVSNIF